MSEGLTNGPSRVDLQVRKKNAADTIDRGQLGIILLALFCMGSALGFERSLLPRMAVQTFHETSVLTILNFVWTFGAAKAVANVVAGPLADRFGRRPTLILGFIIGLPVMPYVNFASTWTGVAVMNVAFGASQGFIGSALFFLLIDVMGPSRRGIAVGIGECTIYVSTALVNILAGDLASRYGFRPIPFWVATFFAILGLLATIPLRDTLDCIQEEQKQSEHDTLTINTTQLLDVGSRIISEYPNEDRMFASQMSQEADTIHSLVCSLPNEASPLITESDALRSLVHSLPQVEDPFYERFDSHSVHSLSVGSATSDDAEDLELLGFKKYCIAKGIQPKTSHPQSPIYALYLFFIDNLNFIILCFGGLAMNFKDGFAWGFFPVFFSHVHKLTDDKTNMLVAIYPLCWGFAQAFTGALSDRYGRKFFLLAGSCSCALAMILFAVPGILWGRPDSDDRRAVTTWIIADVCLGLGTAMAYPALQAGVADEISPVNRGLGLGFYRFTRDMGYVVGALVCGHLTDEIGYMWTFFFVAGVLMASFMSILLAYSPSH